MTRYPLDTAVVSSLLREPRGRIAERIRAVGERQVSNSIIVAAELRYGAAKKGSAALTERVAAILSALNGLAFEAPADAAYGALRARRERGGHPIGGNDLLIAAQAVALRPTLVSGHEREFAGIEGRRFENWLRGA